jgi:uncharacterized Zn-binding protein involved in type VI secretion
MEGKIANGCPKVLIEGERAARKSDLTNHAARIGEGASTVVITSIPAARVADRFVCPSQIGGPHVGGVIMSGAATVLIEGREAARQEDLTLCLAEGANTSGIDGAPGGGADLDAAAEAECARLWAQYDKEARDLLAPADGDHRARNHVINGAYANLYANNKKFAWAGLAAYASKQVGCAMDHSIGVINSPKTFAAQKAVALYTYDKLGEGNRSLFLDIYPMHRFYEEQGWEKFKSCAGERVPPVPAAALDGFAALDRYDGSGDPAELKEHVRSIAFHEQVEILQRDVYDDGPLRRILDANEGNLDDASGKEWLPDAPRWLGEAGGAKPADVVMTSECCDNTPNGAKTIPFNKDGTRNLYDVDERMDWILNDIGGYYLPHMGSPEHMGDIERLQRRGESYGGDYP